MSSEDDEQTVTFPLENEKKPRVKSEKQIAACRANAAKAREVRAAKLLAKLQKDADDKEQKKEQKKEKKSRTVEPDTALSSSDESEESESESEEELELVPLKKEKNAGNLPKNKRAEPDPKNAGKIPRSTLMQQLEAITAENAALKKAKKASRAPVNVYVGGQDKAVTQAQLKNSWSDFN